MDGADGVLLFNKVLGEFGGVALDPKCVFVFIKTCCEVSASLPHMHFIAVGAC
jgi:hypothetical protein